MEKDRIDDSSFVVITGPPQKGKSKRISHVRSVIRKSQLRRDGQVQARPVVRNKSQAVHVNDLGSPSRELTWNMDWSWLTVSETVSKRLRYFFHQYIESSAYLHPFFRAMTPVTVLHPPLMSTKLVNATAWDDLNGPNPEISALTLFQRDIAENMVLDSIAEATSPNADSASSDVTLISLLSLLSFEIINGDEVGYLRHKRNIHRLIDMRGGVDRIDVNLKICLLVIYQQEPVIKGFADSVSPSLDYITENEPLIMSQPTDFKLMTFERGQTQFWDGKIGLSTIRLLSDFFQLVMLSIQYQQLSSNYHQTQNEDMQRRLQIRIQWHFLRDNLIALNSIPFHVKTDPPIDQILLYAISLFVSPSFAIDQAAIEEYITKLQSLLQKSNVLHLYHGPLPGALIWCLIIGARKSDETSSRQSGDLTSVSSTRKWFFMQLMRITCPAALDDPVDVSRNIDMILAGMDGVDCLAGESYHSGLTG